MSLFFVDSGCELDSTQIRNLGIECINLPYEINNEVKEFGENFDFDKFYSKLRKGVVLNLCPLKSEEYVKILEPALEGGDDIIVVHSSNEIFSNKGLLDAVATLKDIYPDRLIELIDSKNMSAGTGVVCYELAKMYHSGATIQEIVDASLDIINTTACYMIVDSLEPLSYNGVVDSSLVIGSSLNIKLIIAIDIDGKVRLIDKVSGRKRAIAKLVQIIRQEGKNVADNTIIVSNSNLTSESADLVSTLKEYFGDSLKLIECRITPSNAVLLGCGSMGVAFKVHRKIH
ncbi:MAG: DegV family EDD domain-containing protein [Clostridiales bacterium]|nr:DegV family EDD domain-containing protein [Clostridiales bacterium]